MIGSIKFASKAASLRSVLFVELQFVGGKSCSEEV
jgi:hypothetical protein